MKTAFSRWAWFLAASLAVCGCGGDGGNTGGSGATGGMGATGGTGATGGMGATGGSGATGGTGATGGMGATGGGGGGGTGGSDNCVDDVGARPSLTSQPTITPTDPVEGGQVEVGFSVSAETRLVRVSFFDGFSDLGGEATVMTSGSESLSVTVDLSDDASAFDYFLGFALCDEDNLDCRTNRDASSVSYVRGTSTTPPGDPYFLIVRDNGVQIIDLGGFSCFDILAIKIPDAP